jgi:hypothetical protein
LVETGGEELELATAVQEVATAARRRRESANFFMTENKPQ